MSTYKGPGPVQLQGLDISADRKWRYGVFTKPETASRWRLWQTAGTVSEARRLLYAAPAGLDAMLLVPCHPAPGRDSVTLLATR